MKKRNRESVYDVPDLYLVHTSQSSRLEKPTLLLHTARHPRKTTTYILYVVSITTLTHYGRKSVGRTNLNDTCPLQLMALLMVHRANYANRYAHQIGQGLHVGEPLQYYNKLQKYIS